MGLSAVAEAVLGKPLDKAMQASTHASRSLTIDRKLVIAQHRCLLAPLTSPQVSDWDRRPLSARQVHYAALDAHVTVRIYEAMGAERVADLSGSDRAGQTP